MKEPHLEDVSLSVKLGISQLENGGPRTPCELFILSLDRILAFF